MTTTRKESAFIAFIAGLAALCLFAFAPQAHANPSLFSVGTTTNGVASSSAVFMTPGTATTTVQHDALAQTFSGGFTYKTDTVGLLTQFCGSSTLAVLTQNIEYSQDGIDWYRNFIIDPSQTGTTTSPWSVGSPFAIKWTYSSTTLATLTAPNNTCSFGAFVLPTPFRYIRIVSSLTGANARVWNQLVPIKQRI